MINYSSWSVVILVSFEAWRTAESLRQENASVIMTSVQKWFPPIQKKRSFCSTSKNHTEGTLACSLLWHSSYGSCIERRHLSNMHEPQVMRARGNCQDRHACQSIPECLFWELNRRHGQRTCFSSHLWKSIMSVRLPFPWLLFIGEYFSKYMIYSISTISKSVRLLLQSFINVMENNEDE